MHSGSEYKKKKYISYDDESSKKGKEYKHHNKRPKGHKVQ